MRRGEIYWASLPPPVGRRPVMVVLRDEGLRRKRSVVVALVSTQVRQLESEVPVGADEGLSRASVVQCDDLQAVDRSLLESRRIGRIGLAKLEALNEAIRYALDVRCPPA